MIKRVLILGMLLVLLIAACSAPADQPATEPAQDEQSATPQITVYKPPT